MNSKIVIFTQKFDLRKSLTAKKNLKFQYVKAESYLYINLHLMKLILRILLTSILVMLLSYFMRGVVVDSFVTALIVSVVLGLLNIFIKPIIVIFTLPVTILTLGLFLLIINALMIMLCSEIVGGFTVDSFWTALLFSIILSLTQSLLFRLTGDDK